MTTGIISIYLVAFTVICNLFIAYVVIRKDKSSITHRLLASLSILLALWAVFNYLALQPADEEIRLFWVRIVMLVTTPLSPLIFFLATVFPAKKVDLNNKLVAITLLINLALAFASFTPLVFRDVKNLGGSNFSLIPGPLIIVFGVNIFVYLIWGTVRLIRKYRASQGSVRKQLQLFLIGMATSFSLMSATNFIAVVVFQSIQLTSLGPPSTLIMLSLLAYAIVKHGLFDIKVVATELFTILILLVLFSKLFAFTSIEELLVDSFLFIAMVIFGYLLIKSVTEEVKQRQRLQELAEQLKELDARKDEFLSIATHELRAPMTAIKGYISMLLDGDAGKLPTEAESFLKVAQSSTDRLIRLVNNMLNVARIEQGRQVYQLGMVHLNEVVNTVFNEFKIDAEKKKLKYNLTIAKDISDSVYVDLDRIHEVVANLISNGIKYTDEGKVEVKLLNPTSSIIRLEVSDSGAGIPLENQSQIFQKYYRVQDRMERKTGTGLGLYISKVLVEKFTGKIGFSSESGKGSTFWFELPVVLDDANKPKIIT